MESATVTIVVVPRERFSRTRASLESIYENTRFPFELLYVDAGSPLAVRDYLAQAARERGFRHLRIDQLLTPNEARNRALGEIQTDYVVCIDNDVMVEPGWLEVLVRCAEETGAWLAGPLYLIGPPGTDRIHMAGGEACFEQANGQRVFRERHCLVGERLGDVGQLRREPTELVEFHCMLARREVFDRVGPLDEELRSTNEHIDLCLLVREAGGSVWFEPAAVVTYVPPPPFAPGDRKIFLHRWSRDANRRSIDRFAVKWNLGRDTLGSQRRWLERHRRKAFGWLRRAPWPLDALLERALR